MISKLIKLAYKNKIIKWVIVPGVLILLWISLSFIYIINSDFSPTTISFNHQAEGTSNQNYSELQGGSILRGNFKAKDNFLGIISIEFKRGNYPIHDQILFRIRELGSEEWLVENTYDARQFHYINKFPLGFPIIENSKNKIYEFEMISKFGTTDRGVSINTLNPVVVSKYKYDVGYLLSEPTKMIQFLSNKLNYALSFPENIKYFITYFLPFVFYYLFLILIKFKKITKNEIKKFISLPPIKFHLDHLRALDSLLGYSLIFLLVFDILIITKVYDLVLLLVVGVWLLNTIFYKGKSKNDFFIALICTYLLVLFLSLGFDSIAEKAALWTYYFLILGSIHGLIELRRKEL